MGYTEKEFFEKIKPYVIEDMKKSNILASLTAAQARLESNIGNSGLTKNANNLFGIKGKYNGQSVTMLTTEVEKGVRVKKLAEFRKYPSWLESISDHSAFLLKYKRYKSIIGEKNYIVACQKMANSGYATENPKTYANSLISIIQKNKLYEWDMGITPTPQAYEIGKTYLTVVNLNIRDNPNGAQLKFECITENAKEHAHFDDVGNAVLNKETRVTCKGLKSDGNKVWMQIPSGWICAIDAGKTYII